MSAPIFEPYLKRWRLTPDGTVIVTPAARLLPVREGTMPAMLKVVTLDEAKRGTDLLTWWDGQGAARVYERDGHALLMERALGERSLVDFVRSGRDDEATQILCDTIATLHRPRGRPAPDLTPTNLWFAPLGDLARTHGGLLARADAVIGTNGTVEHATGDARSDQGVEALRRAVVNVSSARGHMRHEDPNRAIATWAAG